MKEDDRDNNFFLLQTEELLVMLMTGGEADGMHMMLASSLSVFTISQDWCVVNPSVPYNQIQSCAILRQPNFVEWCETIHNDYFTAEKD